jgi:hypothetical protein
MLSALVPAFGPQSEGRSYCRWVAVTITHGYDPTRTSANVLVIKLHNAEWRPVASVLSTTHAPVAEMCC